MTRMALFSLGPVELAPVIRIPIAESANGIIVNATYLIRSLI